MTNQVLQGDCLELMKDIPDGSVDMIMADLPYSTTQCRWDTIIPFEPLWEQYERVIKTNGAIVLTAQQPFTSALIMSNPKSYRYNWVWDKVISTNFMNAKKMPLKGFEDVCVFYKKLPTYNPVMTEGKPFIDKRNNVLKERVSKEIYGTMPLPMEQKNEGTRYPRGFIKISARNNKPIHPTQKPVALMEYLIKTYTNEGDLVLDNVAGSGTTGVACQNLNRNFILMEQEPEYVEIIKQRLKDNSKCY